MFSLLLCYFHYICILGYPEFLNVGRTKSMYFDAKSTNNLIFKRERGLCGKYSNSTEIFVVCAEI